MSIAIKGSGEKFLEMMQEIEREQEEIKKNEPERNDNYHGSLPYYPTQGYAHTYDDFTNEPRNTYFK